MYWLEIDYKGNANCVFAYNVIEFWNYYDWNDLESYMLTSMPRIVANTIMRFARNINPNQPGTPGGGSENPGSGGGTNPNPDQEDSCTHKQCICGKYYMMTRSSICAGHIPCPTNGNCEIEAQLSIPSSVTLGKPYDVNLTITPSSIQTNSIQYKIWRDGTIGYEFNLPHSNIRSFQNRATVPGTWNINATITYGDNKTKVATAQIKHDFPTAAMIKTDSSVVVAMNNAWPPPKHRQLQPIVLK